MQTHFPKQFKKLFHFAEKFEMFFSHYLASTLGEQVVKVSQLRFTAYRFPELLPSVAEITSFWHFSSKLGLSIATEE
jgi:hypothetical protein